MNACPILRRLLLGVTFLPFISIAQNGYVRPTVYPADGTGEAVSRRIPLNEINIHAYRRFHKRWPSVRGEAWSKNGEEYSVAFMEGPLHSRVYFDLRGSFLYALTYYPGEKISTELNGVVKNKYPDYLIKVVTEVTDGNKTFYLVNIENASSVKTLSFIDGKLDVKEDLINGSLTRN